MIIKTRSAEETFELGIKIGRVLNRGDIISLNGDLGAGKTQLTKGIAKGLEVDEHITSPTFTIVNEYSGKLPLYHFDVYRINDVDELYEIGFDEYIFGNGVSIIEWGDMICEILPKDIIKINIKKVDEDIREIHIDSKKTNFGGIK
ncbi:MAG: tRNA (adenosine(37)-N6)-threonylcarbamoyltransferase complex ATPase subunit type 1 TsaE [Caloramator sp.]|nr:tRNA (adenosine(37)-N6)-threonylcarbamoyltransferase complex ATPase subunit type 1 TsaE [Caloramator sp.]